jgi:hypothetical protein
MDNLHNLYLHYSWLLPLFIFILIWDSVWKLIGLWKSARNNQIVWFICIAIINTLGILPIVYIIMDRKKGQV